MSTLLSSEQVKHSGQLLSDLLANMVTYKAQSSSSWDPPAVAAGAYVTANFTVTGAALGDAVIASFAADTTGLVLSAHVSAANTVTVTLRNLTGSTVNLNAATLKLRVLA